MADTWNYTAASGSLQTNGPLRFHPDSNLGTVTLTFNSENLSEATLVSDDGGVTWSSFTLVSSGTTSDGMNNNFYKDFDEFSADAPPTYNVIEFNSTQYVFFPNSPNAEGRLSGNIQLVESVPPCFTAGTLIQTARGECHELCVSGLAHAGFRYGHALKRSSNMIAKWLRAANHSRTFRPPFSKLRIAR